MKNKFKFLVTFTLIMTLLLGNTCNVLAASVNSENQQLVYLSDGYTADGVHYQVYEVISPSMNTGISPCIVASKIKTFCVAFEGKIVPPATFQYSQYESDYKTTMKGTLDLQSYSYDIWPYYPCSTKATYRGYIFGTI